MLEIGATSDMVFGKLADSGTHNRDQGFTPCDADTVIAAGALDNARDSDATLMTAAEDVRLRSSTTFLSRAH
ncbi:hypothetical protein [Amycolatopsis speibonae]|uniref:Uncharacterized protein n=1 Tax=Amycolatopsis speibonae TaxID=1450224 RepID=A0ABV7P295_9PSEU